MALWGKNDNVTVASDGTVTLDYDTKEVIGTGTTFGDATVGSAKTGDIIRFGFRDATAGVGTYFGDAVIVGIASTTSLTIGSTAGLSGVAIADTSFTIAELPKSSIVDASYSENTGVGGTTDKFIYGISTAGVGAAQSTAFDVAHAGWVGIQTYMDQHGTLRVKSEVLVAMSGITTGNRPTFPGQK